MSEEFSWKGSSSPPRSVDIKVTLAAATLAASPFALNAQPGLVTPPPAVSTPLPNNAPSGATASQSIRSETMAGQNQTPASGRSLSAATWLGLGGLTATIAIPLIIGAVGLFDIKSGLATLEGKVDRGFERVDGNLVQVRERVARVEALQDARQSQSSSNSVR